MLYFTYTYTHIVCYVRERERERELRLLNPSKVLDIFSVQKERLKQF